MKNNKTLFSLFFTMLALIPLGIGQASDIAGTWFDASYRYRIVANINTGYTPKSGSLIIKKSVDFDNILKKANIDGTIDPNSIAVTDQNGNRLLSDTIRYFDSGKATVRWLLASDAFIPANTKLTYYIYFDILENGMKPHTADSNTSISKEFALVSSSGQGQGLYIGQSFGDGSFYGWRLVQKSGGFENFCIADFDNDSDYDFATVGGNAKSVTLFFNEGHDSQEFFQAEISTSGVGKAIREGDFNEDGYIDLALHANGQFHVLINRFGKTFVDYLIDEKLSYTNASAIAVEDMNGDRHADVILGYDGGKIDLFKGDGKGNFIKQADFIQQNLNVSGLWALDYDKDNDIDLLISETGATNGNVTSNPVWLFKNMGNGTFLKFAEEQLSVITNGGGSVWDWNNDGFPDITRGVFDNSGKLYIYLGTDKTDSAFSAPQAVADIEGIDYTGYHANWGGLSLISDITVSYGYDLEYVALSLILPKGQAFVKSGDIVKVTGRPQTTEPLKQMGLYDQNNNSIAVSNQIVLKDGQFSGDIPIPQLDSNVTALYLKVIFNNDSEMASNRVFVDNIKPELKIVDPVDNIYLESKWVRIIGTVNDDIEGSGISIIQYSFDGNTWTDFNAGTHRLDFEALLTCPNQNAIINPSNGNYYFVSPNTLTWSGAAADCQLLNAHLVTINSAKENNWIIANLPLASYGVFWIGASDSEKEGVWQWVTNESWEYTNWYVGEPNNSKGSENVAQLYMTTGGPWYDVADSNWRRGICEWETKTIPRINVALAKNGGVILGKSSNLENAVDEGLWGASHLIDGKISDDLQSAWATSGEGLGLWVTIGFDRAYRIDGVSLANRLSANERNQDVKLEFSDGSTQSVTLKNNDFLQYFDLQPVTTNWIKFTVTSVYATQNNGFKEIQIFSLVDSYLDPDGNWIINADMTGKSKIMIHATDNAGQHSDRTISVNYNPESQRFFINQPLAYSYLNGRVDIMGTVFHRENFLGYSLSYIKGENNQSFTGWQIICSGNNPVENDILCSWNTYSLDDGAYTVKLVMQSIGETKQVYRTFLKDTNSPNPSSFSVNLPEQNADGFIRSGQAIEIKGQANESDSDISDIKPILSDSTGKILVSGPSLLVYSVDNTGELYCIPINLDGSFDLGSTGMGYLIDKVRGTRSLEVADFTGDGMLDVMVAERDVYLYKQIAPHEFAKIFVYSTVGPAFGSCAADFDNDGDLDFVMFHDKTNAFYFQNIGNDKFNFLDSLPIGNGFRGAAAADLNADTKIDILVAERSTGNLLLYAGNGDNTFENPVVIANIAGDLYGLAASDLNKDGIYDIVVSCGYEGSIWLLEGLGNGEFAQKTLITDINRYCGLSLNDIDTDGNLDLILANWDGKQLYWYHGNGNGTFQQARFISSVPGNVMGIDVGGVDYYVRSSSKTPDNSFDTELILALSSNNTQYIQVQMQFTDSAGNISVSKPEGFFVSDNVPPSIDIIRPMNLTYSDSSVEIEGIASDFGAGVAFVQISIDGGLNFPYTAQGTGNWKIKIDSLQDSAYVVVAKAFDSVGNSALSYPVTVICFQKGTIIDIRAPMPDKSVKCGKIEILGTASGEQFFSYVLQYRKTTVKNLENWATITQSASPVQNGVLGVFDTTGFDSGSYTLRLTVNDLQGIQRFIERFIKVDPIAPQKPNAPKIIYFPDGTPNPIWESSSESTRWHLYRKDASESSENWTRIASFLSEPFFHDSQIVFNRSYLYAISAIDDAGNESLMSEPSQTEMLSLTTVIINNDAALTHTRDILVCISGMSLEKMKSVFISEQDQKPATVSNEWIEIPLQSPSNMFFKYSFVRQNNDYNGIVQKSLYVFASDQNGNIEKIGSDSIDLDIRGTSVTISGEPDGITSSAIANIKINARGAGIGVFKYRLDQNEWSSEIAITLPVTIDGLKDGKHQIAVIIKYADGVWQDKQSAILSKEWTVDSIPPVVSGLSNDNSAASSKTWSWSATDESEVSFRYVIDQNPSNTFVKGEPILCEDFENQTATGWNNAGKAYQQVQAYGEYGYALGGYGQTAHTELSKTYDLSNSPHERLFVCVEYFAIDSWDSEKAYVKADGQTIFEEKNSYSMHYSNIPNTSGSWKDQVIYIEKLIEHNKNSLNITIGSTLDQDANDESFAVGLVCLYNEPESQRLAFENVRNATLHDVQGRWYLHVQAKDAAGNLSNIVTVYASFDRFPNDPAASYDTDNDGFPDSWDEGKTQADSTTGLMQDAFPNDLAAAFDTDSDGKPDGWLATATQDQINLSPLILDNDIDNDTLLNADDPDPLKRDADDDGYPDPVDSWKNGSLSPIVMHSMVSNKVSVILTGQDLRNLHGSEDNNPKTLVYSTDQASANLGISVDSTGIVRWIPTQRGTYPLTVTAQSFGGAYSVVKKFDIKVDRSNPELEPNDKTDAAQSIAFGARYKGNIEQSADVDYYQIHADYPVIIRIGYILESPTVNKEQNQILIQVFDSNNRAIGQGTSDKSGLLELDVAINTAAFFKLSYVDSVNGFKDILNYTLLCQPVADFYPETEPTNINPTSDEVFTGYIVNTSEQHHYRFSINTPRYIILNCITNATDAAPYYRLSALQTNGFESQNVTDNMLTERGFYLPPGEYEIAIGRSISGVFPLIYKLIYTDMGIAEQEPNNDINHASQLVINQNATMKSAWAIMTIGDTDYFAIEVDKPMSLNIALLSQEPMFYTTDIIFGGKTIYSISNNEVEVALYPGTFYLKVNATQGFYSLNAYETNEAREFEPNDGIGFANTLTEDQNINASLYSAQDKDYLAFYQTQGGWFDLAVEADKSIHVRILDANNRLYFDEDVNDTLISVGLKQGTHYVEITGNGYSEYHLLAQGDIDAINRLIKVKIKGEQFMEIGDSQSLAFYSYYLDGSEVEQTQGIKWSTSDTNQRILKLGNDGEITAIGKGEVTIFGEYAGMVDSMTVNIAQQQVKIQHHGNLILVAGGGVASTNILKESTQYLADLVYRRFRQRIFTDADIYYFNPITWHDIDGDGYDNAIVDNDTIKTGDFELSITQWAVKQASDGPLYIYLIDHGGTDTFKLQQGEILTAQNLNAYLDSFQSATGRQVVVMIEACKSGSFTDNLVRTGMDRIVVTSTDTNDAYLFMDGTISFTQFFADQLLTGNSIMRSYDSAKQKLASLGLPYNLMEPKLVEGLSLTSERITIGGDFAIASLFPEITSHTLSTVITNNSPVNLNAKISDLEGIQSVWAVIVPPGYNPPERSVDLEAPSVNLPTVTLSQVGVLGNFEGKYSGFNQSGKYRVTFYAKNTNGNVSVSLPVEITVRSDKNVAGDINADGILTLSDIILSLMINASVSTENHFVNASADVDGNKKINMVETVYLFNELKRNW